MPLGAFVDVGLHARGMSGSHEEQRMLLLTVEVCQHSSDLDSCACLCIIPARWCRDAQPDVTF